MPLLVFLAGWHLICAGNQRRTFLFSTPGRVAQQFWEDLTSGVLAGHAGITASEALVGFILATLAGTIIGLLLASWSRLSDIVAPYLGMLGAVPVYALAPMTIIWFGIGFWQKAGIAFLSTVFVATNQAFQGASHPPDDQMLIFRAFRARPLQVLWKLRFPVALAWVASGCRLNVGFAFLGAFLGEIISSNVGLGHYIMKASSLYDVPRVLSGVLALLMVAFAIDKAVSALFVARARSMVR
ncbi:MAG: ABC transporter permease [Pseudomonadota bacterium]|nr:ABC transporter permease [Gammaproteobacteria bacterium]MDQ3581178.1 ABC transporter permease [Pseudomonadota bacterium]